MHRFVQYLWHKCAIIDLKNYSSLHLRSVSWLSSLYWYTSHVYTWPSCLSVL